MALIKCPECKKEVSDQATVCIHCGYPLKTKTLCKINGMEQDLSFILDKSIEKTKKIKIFRELTNCGLKTALETIDNLIDKQEIPKVLNLPIQQVEENKPKCPTCSSTNIKPISGTERATSIIGLGIFSKKINKTYKCLNCKCTW